MKRRFCLTAILIFTVVLSAACGSALSIDSSFAPPAELPAEPLAVVLNNFVKAAPEAIERPIHSENYLILREILLQKLNPALANPLKAGDITEIDEKRDTKHWQKPSPIHSK